MAPISPAKLERVFAVLAEREFMRMQGGKTPNGFYSVLNSLKHRPDNRYSNILAYDRTAVVVGDEGKYLNANKVEDGKGGTWIAAQAPTPRTFDTFFQALYSGAATGKRSRDVILVQLTGWEENGMRKADFYLEHAMDHLPLKLIKSEQIPSISSTVTHLQLGHPPNQSTKDAGEEAVTIHHYHFDAWPDHGVPTGQDVAALRNLVLEVERKRKELSSEVWVHCSAGVGRTGSFIALSSLLTPDPPSIIASAPQPATALEPLPSDLQGDRVARTVDAIRECRGMLVQNPDQLRLIYEMQ
ncbi:hypothetical protein I317_07280 [Kwoniella heveanensis CBS 569]|uniref:Protein-tyrosine phosphatase n=1 Tax=Kwoniella heveanensis BCC8398 TaxID=1296120 RepID=A0A1B9GXY1_9TREE|nr:hypothetical protein I316_02359 [Kwoniella heveanensis BCC8398]OCF38943.1 hypothetical protein I317_07280 [Kwoniella heveanensis CBS 569]